MMSQSNNRYMLEHNNCHMSPMCSIRHRHTQTDGLDVGSMCDSLNLEYRMVGRIFKTYIYFLFESTR
jgi:hypothetical protein